MIRDERGRQLFAVRLSALVAVLGLVVLLSSEQELCEADVGSALQSDSGWWWRKQTHDVRFGRVRLVVFPSERLRLRSDMAFRISLEVRSAEIRAHLRPLSRALRAAARTESNGTEPDRPTYDSDSSPLVFCQ